MAQQLTDLLTPFILALATALAGVLTVLIHAAKTSLIAWIQARTNAAQQEIIMKVASEAMAFAETQGLLLKGQEKMNAAIAYAANELQTRGLNVTPDKLLAAIQKAWMEYNPAQNKADKAMDMKESDTAPASYNKAGSV
ncbi:phage holin, LLH family [Paenibacillus chitinolyticus]|uniref:phage holin, LLH family n=1 Tax=Paenibacillus chitinolyticus TaxID=79263 RepID=UPI002DC02E05|nr:phage holin, LLH family [Paenibacillus chitinolyticus]MEC0248725.1 phage holin, LLH family [Paenibacillus chitinolyticus]